MALWLKVEPQTAVNADLKLSIILDADTRANSDELFTRLDWLPLHLDVNVNICVQVHKRINGRRTYSWCEGNKIVEYCQIL